jgi:hypothetical protein
VRSLGVPVKSSDKREPNEAEACIPKVINTPLTTSKAIPMTLCIPLSSCTLRQEFAKKLALFSGLESMLSAGAALNRLFSVWVIPTSNQAMLLPRVRVTPAIESRSPLDRLIAACALILQPPQRSRNPS